MSIIYEWDIETVQNYEDGNNDILEHNHCKSYAEAVLWKSRQPAAEGISYEIVLVRDDYDGRSWAYVTDGALPEQACDAYDAPVGRVPRRFHDEVSKAL